MLGYPRQWSRPRLRAAFRSDPTQPNAPPISSFEPNHHAPRTALRRLSSLPFAARPVPHLAPACPQSSTPSISYHPASAFCYSIRARDQIAASRRTLVRARCRLARKMPSWRGAGVEPRHHWASCSFSFGMCFSEGCRFEKNNKAWGLDCMGDDVCLVFFLFFCCCVWRRL